MAVLYRVSDRVFSLLRYKWDVRYLYTVLTIMGLIFIIPFVAKFSGDPRFFDFSFSSVETTSNLNALFWGIMLPYIVFFF